MSLWTVELHEEFDVEFQNFDREIRIEIAGLAGLLAQFGPELRRPHCDTLNGSKFANMKELRFIADGGVWRLAFAFDPERTAILLVAGDKSGVSSRRFYKNLVATADNRFETHIGRLGKK